MHPRLPLPLLGSQDSLNVQFVALTRENMVYYSSLQFIMRHDKNRQERDTLHDTPMHKCHDRELIFRFA